MWTTGTCDGGFFNVNNEAEAGNQCDTAPGVSGSPVMMLINSPQKGSMWLSGVHANGFAVRNYNRVVLLTGENLDWVNLHR